MDELWYNYDLANMKDQTKCIRQLEKICRSSFEYDEWQRNCKLVDNQECPVCGENYYDKNNKIESHHHPKTLYVVVEEIIVAHMEKNTIMEKTGIQIVQEIMDKHLLNQVQYINLCQHCHRKYHDGHPDVINKMDDIFNARSKQDEKEYNEEFEKLEKLENEIQSPHESVNTVYIETINSFEKLQ